MTGFVNSVMSVQDLDVAEHVRLGDDVQEVPRVLNVGYQLSR